MGPYAAKEALASAKIEGTQAALEEVFEAERRSVERYREVLTVQNYLRALRFGLREVRSGGGLSFELLSQVQEMLVGSTAAEAGQLRSGPVWLGSPTERPETAVFVPPTGQALRDSIADLESFVTSPPPLPPLVRAALLHYQFLTIHPFRDGNGRTGRLFTLLFLAAENRLPVPLLYISPYFERRRRDYYDGLQAVRERGEIQQWCQFFMAAVEAQANDGVNRARRLLALRERYRAELLGSRNRAVEIVELLFENPVLTTATIRDQLQVTTQGALNLIRSIEARGWLTRIGTLGRGGAMVWRAEEIFHTIRDDAPDRDATTMYPPSFGVLATAR
jgi:Fic family protein